MSGNPCKRASNALGALVVTGSFFVGFIPILFVCAIGYILGWVLEDALLDLQALLRHSSVAYDSAVALFQSLAFITQIVYDVLVAAVSAWDGFVPLLNFVWGLIQPLFAMLLSLFDSSDTESGLRAAGLEQEIVTDLSCVMRKLWRLVLNNIPLIGLRSGELFEQIANYVKELIGGNTTFYGATCGRTGAHTETSFCREFGFVMVVIDHALSKAINWYFDLLQILYDILLDIISAIIFFVVHILLPTISFFSQLVHLLTHGGSIGKFLLSQAESLLHIGVIAKALCLVGRDSHFALCFLKNIVSDIAPVLNKVTSYVNEICIWNSGGCGISIASFLKTFAAQDCMVIMDQKCSSSWGSVSKAFGAGAVLNAGARGLASASSGVLNHGICSTAVCYLALSSHMSHMMPPSASTNYIASQAWYDECLTTVHMIGGGAWDVPSGLTHTTCVAVRNFALEHYDSFSATELCAVLEDDIMCTHDAPVCYSEPHCNHWMTVAIERTHQEMGKTYYDYSTVACSDVQAFSSHIGMMFAQIVHEVAQLDRSQFIESFQLAQCFKEEVLRLCASEHDEQDEFFESGFNGWLANHICECSQGNQTICEAQRQQQTAAPVVLHTNAMAHPYGRRLAERMSSTQRDIWLMPGQPYHSPRVQMFERHNKSIGELPRHLRVTLARVLAHHNTSDSDTISHSRILKFLMYHGKDNKVGHVLVPGERFWTYNSQGRKVPLFPNFTIRPESYLMVESHMMGSIFSDAFHGISHIADEVEQAVESYVDRQWDKFKQLAKSAASGVYKEAMKGVHALGDVMERAWDAFKTWVKSSINDALTFIHDESKSMDEKLHDASGIFNNTLHKLGSGLDFIKQGLFAFVNKLKDAAVSDFETLKNDADKLSNDVIHIQQELDAKIDHLVDEAKQEAEKPITDLAESIVKFILDVDDSIGVELTESERAQLESEISHDELFALFGKVLHTLETAGEKGLTDAENEIDSLSSKLESLIENEFSTIWGDVESELESIAEGDVGGNAQLMAQLALYKTHREGAAAAMHSSATSMQSADVKYELPAQNSEAWNVCWPPGCSGSNCTLGGCFGTYDHCVENPSNKTIGVCAKTVYTGFYKHTGGAVSHGAAHAATNFTSKPHFSNALGRASHVMNNPHKAPGKAACIPRSKGQEYSAPTRTAGRFKTNNVFCPAVHEGPHEATGASLKHTLESQSASTPNCGVHSLHSRAIFALCRPSNLDNAVEYSQCCPVDHVLWCCPNSLDCTCRCVSHIPKENGEPACHLFDNSRRLQQCPNEQNDWGSHRLLLEVDESPPEYSWHSTGVLDAETTLHAVMSARVLQNMDANMLRKVANATSRVAAAPTDLAHAVASTAIHARRLFEVGTKTHVSTQAVAKNKAAALRAKYQSADFKDMCIPDASHPFKCMKDAKTPYEGCFGLLGCLPMPPDITITCPVEIVEHIRDAQCNDTMNVVLPLLWRVPVVYVLAPITSFFLSVAPIAIRPTFMWLDGWILHVQVDLPIEPSAAVFCYLISLKYYFVLIPVVILAVLTFVGLAFYNK